MQSKTVSIRHVRSTRKSYQVRNQPCPSHVPNGLLRWLRLLFSLDHRDQGDMNLQKVPLPGTSLQLTHGFNEGSTLNITNRTTQFNNAYICALICIINRNSRNSLNPVLDCVCEMRHNLDSFPEIVATTLTFDYVLIYLSGGDVILASKCDVEIALVVAKVEVDFTAIVEDKNFTMPTITSTTQL